MRQIRAGLFITLDGVFEAPGDGDTTLPGKRGWSMPYTNEEVGMAIMSQMDSTDALLLGRVTYDGFAAFWPNVPEDDPFSQRMNSGKKYVVSTTLNTAEWKNSTLIQGNLVEEITKLKQQPGKDIGMSGSGTLVASLLENDLLDELKLFLCPVVLGVGKKLFKDGIPTKTLTLVEAKGFSSGMVGLTYHKG
ncbi:MAG: dihydrofolate reductase family protein [Chloroflexota bacterium]